jgi:hypothetical protein
MTAKQPDICVHDGIRIDYEKRFTAHTVQDVLTKLLKCSHTGKVVATPIYGYNYDPENVNPHHVTGMTLFYNPRTKSYTFNYFNPKGARSVRKRREIRLLERIGGAIQKNTGNKVNIYYYNGSNLQEDDSIGLCQLYSLLYLFEFLGRPGAYSPSTFVQRIQNQRGSFNEKTLLAFYRAFIK